MSDGTRLNVGSGGDLIFTEDCGDSEGKIPCSKIVLGDLNSNDGDVSASNPLPVVGGTSVGKYLSNTGGTSFSVVKNSGGKLWGWQIQNTSASVIYLQIFDSLSPTVGSLNPVLSLFIPASGGIDAYLESPLKFNTAITISATTTPLGSSAPSSAVNCNFFYS